MPLVATLVLVLGVADQSLTKAHVQNNTSFEIESAFMRTLETMVAPHSSIFQDPYIPFPEGGHLGSAIDSDSLRPWLTSTDLRFSGGGIKGRPQSLWPATVEKETPATRVRNLAIVGFAGVLVDRTMTTDNGKALEAGLRTELGAPLLVSSDGLWAYYTLSKQLAEVAKDMSPAARRWPPPRSSARPNRPARQPTGAVSDRRGEPRRSSAPVRRAVGPGRQTEAAGTVDSTLNSL